jgi:hypothetical protein
MVHSLQIGPKLQQLLVKTKFECDSNFSNKLLGIKSKKLIIFMISSINKFQYSKYGRFLFFLKKFPHILHIYQ